MTPRSVGSAATHTPARALPRVRILVVDDHGVVRDALSMLLESRPGLHVVGTAATGEDAVAAAARLQPNIILMDLVLPHLNGIDAARRILAVSPEIRIIALSAFHTPAHVQRALRAGFRGYVRKTADSEEVMHAVAEVSCGRPYMSLGSHADFCDARAAPLMLNSFENLSGREREILRLIAGGATSLAISVQLSLSSKTVDSYRSRIMVKLGVSNRTALIRMALNYELPLA